jgi:hypothetical protein
MRTSDDDEMTELLQQKQKQTLSMEMKSVSSANNIVCYFFVHELMFH